MGALSRLKKNMMKSNLHRKSVNKHFREQASVGPVGDYKLRTVVSPKKEKS